MRHNKAVAMVGEELSVDNRREYFGHRAGAAESPPAFLDGHGTQVGAIVDDHEARGFVFGGSIFKVALHGNVDVVGETHHDNVGSRIKVVHAMFVHLSLVVLAQEELNAVVQFKERIQMLLTIVPIVWAYVVPIPYVILCKS